MAFKDQYLLTQNEEFKQRVAMAVQTCALQILKEPVDTSTRLGKARWGSASTVVGSRSLDAHPFTSMLAADPSISAASTDQELLDAVLGLWDVMSGVPVEGA
tara:strand:+ start:103 stop:408 length:306 start_codon:yes stop_codon:yes gene_type:complete